LEPKKKKKRKQEVSSVMLSDIYSMSSFICKKGAKTLGKILVRCRRADEKGARPAAGPLRRAEVGSAQ
jgi:hypothetical protein